MNSDGTLNINGGSATTVSFDGNKTLSVTLAGGAVNFNGAVDLLRGSTAPGPSWFDFTAVGSTFTASFGVDFADLATVGTYIGDGLTFRSTTNLDLVAADNEDGTFTVSVVPEPSAALLGGLGMLCLLRRRR